MKGNQAIINGLNELLSYELFFTMYQAAPFLAQLHTFVRLL